MKLPLFTSASLPATPSVSTPLNFWSTVPSSVSVGVRTVVDDLGSSGDVGVVGEPRYGLIKAVEIVGALGRDTGRPHEESGTGGERIIHAVAQYAAIGVGIAQPVTACATEGDDAVDTGAEDEIVSRCSSRDSAGEGQARAVLGADAGEFFSDGDVSGEGIVARGNYCSAPRWVAANSVPDKAGTPEPPIVISSPVTVMPPESTRDPPPLTLLSPPGAPWPPDW